MPWGAYLGTDGIAYAGSLNNCYTVINDSGIEVGQGVGAYSEYGSRCIYIDPINVWMNRGSYGCGFEVTSGGNMWTYVAIDYFGSSAEDNLGSSSYRWGTLYNKKNNTSSDMRLKYNIEDLDDRYLDLFDLLRPVCYSTDPDKGSDVSKISVGFIAQEVEEALYDCDLDSTMMSIVDDGEHISDPDYAEPYYSLSYNEFIAILVHKVKQLEFRIAEMEAVNG